MCSASGSVFMFVEAKTEGDSETWISGLTSRRSQSPLVLAIPVLRFQSRVDGGSAFYVRRIYGQAKIDVFGVYCHSRCLGHLWHGHWKLVDQKVDQVGR
jgi:hypothetical protein